MENVEPDWFAFQLEQEKDVDIWHSVKSLLRKSTTADLKLV